MPVCVTAGERVLYMCCSADTRAAGLVALWQTLYTPAS